MMLTTDKYAQSIVRKRLKLESKIAEYNEKIKELENSCMHHNLRYRYDGTSGGWDSQGSYWVDWYCPDCDKKWSTSQDIDLINNTIKKYPTAKKVDRWILPYEYVDFYEKN